MASSPAAAKRKRAADGAPVSDWSTDEVVAWLRGCDAVPPDSLAALLARVEDAGIDGEVLATLTEDDLGECLRRRC